MRKKKIVSPGTAALIESMAELAKAVEEGATLKDLKNRFPSRTRIIAPAPGKHSPASVAALREQFGATQADFASLVGVSRILVQSWERGVRQPSMLARRLLDTIQRDPSSWLASLSRRRNRAG